MRLLGLIPARGGSKGVPRKNIKLLGRKPLIAYTIEAAKGSGVFSELFVSTDDEEIATVVTNYGVPVPFLRPAALAGDTTPMLDVIRHVISWFEAQDTTFDAVCLLQPTCPFRSAGQIQEAVALFKNGGFDSLISVLELPRKYNPYWVYIENEKGSLKLFSGHKQPVTRRQDLPKAYIREGSIYLFKLETIKRFGNIYGENIGYMPVEDLSVNIDTLEDFDKAERLLKTITL